jgi:hypothetical protein
VAPYGMLIFLLLLFQPRANFIFFDVIDSLGRLVGLDTFLVGHGRDLFMFWR